MVERLYLGVGQAARRPYNARGAAGDLGVEEQICTSVRDARHRHVLPQPLLTVGYGNRALVGGLADAEHGTPVSRPARSWYSVWGPRHRMRTPLIV